jgi:hypothetical protein
LNELLLLLVIEGENPLLVQRGVVVENAFTLYDKNEKATKSTTTVTVKPTFLLYILRRIMIFVVVVAVVVSAFLLY